MTYKLFRTMIRSKKQKQEEKRRRKKEERARLVRGLKVPLEKYPKTIPQAFTTFDLLAKKHPESAQPQKRKREGLREPHFGKAPRFVKSAVTKWKDDCKRFNSFNKNGKTIDLKNGPVPGPSRYNLVYKRRGKVRRGKRSSSAVVRRGDQVDRYISKGISKSIYHPKNC